jgi:ABC-2 type transport system permease protein
MMLLFHAEWLRFLRNKTNLIILTFAFIIFSTSAVWSALEANTYRIHADEKQLAWMQYPEDEKRFIQEEALAENEESPAAARRAFELGRTNTPPALKPALGGLALGIQQFTNLPSDVRVSILSRHIEGRKSDGDVISNPLLQGVGLPDFSVILALLIPLCIIGLSYGLVQEAREQGIWRTVCAQHSAPWKILAVALSVRFIAIVAVVGFALILACMIDSGSSMSAYTFFSLVLLVYCLIWILIVGIMNLFRITSAASALSLLSLWLFLTYVIPSSLSFSTQMLEPSPSQTQALIDVRNVAIESEEETDPLIREWYAMNPHDMPKSFNPYGYRLETFYISFIPRYMKQDAVIAAQMHAIEAVRGKRETMLESWAWTSPGIALVLAANKLSGGSATQHALYINEVNSFEKQWKDFLIPKIMSVRGLRMEDVDALPVFNVAVHEAFDSVIMLLIGQLIVVLALFIVFFTYRRMLARP